MIGKAVGGTLAAAPADSTVAIARLYRCRSRFSLSSRRVSPPSRTCANSRASAAYASEGLRVSFVQVSASIDQISDLYSFCRCRSTCEVLPIDCDSSRAGSVSWKTDRSQLTDDSGYRGAKLSLDVIERNPRVFDDVVQPRCGNHRLILADGGNQLRHGLQVHFGALPGRIPMHLDPMVAAVGKQLGGLDELAHLICNEVLDLATASVMGLALSSY